MGADPDRPLAGHPILTGPGIGRILAVLGADGTPVRVVGGAVRDALLGQAADAGSSLGLPPSGPLGAGSSPGLPPPGLLEAGSSSGLPPVGPLEADLDLATPLRPEAVAARLEAAGIKAVPTGIAHGTVTAVLDGRPFEITTLRRDVATDGRHAVVAYTDDFDADAARRDFTINAMSADPSGRVHDPFGGRADLAAGVVRFVGEPGRRIAEDYLRVLRFFRFHARFNRGPTDRGALAACARAAPELRRLSGERLRQETLKLLAARDPLPTLRLMEEAGVTAHLLGTPVAHGRLARLVGEGDGGDALLRLAALLRPPPAGPETAVRLAGRFRLSNRERDRLLALCASPLPQAGTGERAWRQAIYDHGQATFADLVRLADADAPWPETARSAALALAEGWTPPPPPVQGKDLVALGIAPGPELGRRLDAVIAWWRGEDFRPDREACLDWLRRQASGPAEG
ncbi:CCA tRNA nucleotidyltransferase [Marinivivus vitaminiproducens]|uniref:CCA tRNA nucleotidyltransferase n=1 Tax=Marinivivus vitaminiproducens TaxID=3035935 RepID=UPI0027A7F8FC|nr:CCA tRNA nucleotidyltransferase [Geminicoccaceae bacterium SCSIO 64248]